MDGVCKLIYYINVMMCLVENFCVICFECIDNFVEKKNVIYYFKEDGKEIIDIIEF